MDVVPVHFAAELNAWDEPQRLQRVKPRFVKMANAIHGIVIGNCQIGKSGRFSRGDDLFRCKPAVRKLVKMLPASCIPSPESPEKCTTTLSSSFTSICSSIDYFLFMLVNRFLYFLAFHHSGEAYLTNFLPLRT